MRLKIVENRGAKCSMIYIEHNENDLFVLSQKVLARLLSEMQKATHDFVLAQVIPKKVGILMFVEPLGRVAEGVSKPSFFCPGFQRQVYEHLREIISDDRRLSGLVGMDIKVTVKPSEPFTKPNVIGLVFNFS